MWTPNRARGVVPGIRSLVVALVGVAFLTISLAACGGGEEAAAPAHESETGAQAVDIVSKAVAFDKSEIRVASGQEITIRHDNQDEGVVHNIAIYKTSEAQDLIAGTELEPGPVEQELVVEALEPGEYFYRCDLHPTQMTGVLIVEE